MADILVDLKLPSLQSLQLWCEESVQTQDWLDFVTALLAWENAENLREFGLHCRTGGVEYDDPTETLEARLRRLKFTEIGLQDIYPTEELMLFVKRSFPFLATINDQPLPACCES